MSGVQISLRRRITDAGNREVPLGLAIIHIQEVDILPEKEKTKDVKSKPPEKDSGELLEHTLVPVHEILSEEEANALIERIKATSEQLPKIFTSDPAIQHLSPKVGNVVMITRNSQTAGTSTYYRIVIEGKNIPQKEEIV